MDIPIVVDHHHDAIVPSAKSIAEYWPEIESVWKKRGIKPKQHVSESRVGASTPMEKRAHGDRVTRLPGQGKSKGTMTVDIDLQIEAKDKEQAVFQLYKTYNLYPVNEAVYSPFGNKTKVTKVIKKTRKVRNEVKIEKERIEEEEEEDEEKEILQIIKGIGRGRSKLGNIVSGGTVISRKKEKSTRQSKRKRKLVNTNLPSEDVQKVAMDDSKETETKGDIEIKKVKRK